MKSLYFSLVVLLSSPLALLFSECEKKCCHEHCGSPPCGTVPYPSTIKTPDPILHSPQVWSFKSEPDLHPMKVEILTNKKGTSPGYIFVAPYTLSEDAMYGQTGSLIMDNCGNPIWFRPLSSPNLMNIDFRVQTLWGKQVLTFWQGTVATPTTYTNLPAGSSEPGSCFYILDKHYNVIRTVKARNGFISDVHEFLITPRNTALFLSTKTIPMDLTPYGGPSNGFVQDFAIQEIDLESNRLLFFWDALDHIPLTDSFEPASTATQTNNVWDVYHLNSIGLTDNKEDILLSGRNTWTIYRINKPTGDIVWRLGGKQNDFQIEPDALFSWQHDARFLSDNVISLFDDNCCGSQSNVSSAPPARGLLIKLDLCCMRATKKRTYFHDPNLQVSSQGNLQSLKNGNKFIGWGQEPYYTEYLNPGNNVDDPALNLIYDAKMPGNNFSYRAYRHKWIGKPCYPPSIAVRTCKSHVLVYASWNGSTETAAWRVYAGSCPTDLKEVKTVSKDGFETKISVRSCGPYFKAKALNAKGKVIGESDIVYVENK